VWLWWGQSTNANTDLIPDFRVHRRSKISTIHGTIITRGHYELVTDNLMTYRTWGLCTRAVLEASRFKAASTRYFKQAPRSIRTGVPGCTRPPVWNVLFNNYKPQRRPLARHALDAPASMLLDVGWPLRAAGARRHPELVPAPFLTHPGDNRVAYASRCSDGRAKNRLASYFRLSSDHRDVRAHMRDASLAPLPAGATPTSRSMLAGVQRMSSQWSTLRL